ncbi:MAG: FAD-dependent oxidoreductase [Gammaproteobacteria bacterium]|nr:FAD-dependent oxidoreductase [Gammaproteobacteria bacterium]
MKSRVLVLGAGFGGMELSTLLSEAFGEKADVTLIDKGDAFVFGFSKLDVMFGRTTPEAVRLPYRGFVKPGVRFLRETIKAIDPVARHAVTDKGTYEADFLVVALGADFDLAATPGLAEGGNEFYSVAGATRLREVLPTFSRGHAIVGVAAAPFKCPPAPSECALLLDEYLTTRGVRSECEITLVLPLSSPSPPRPNVPALVDEFARKGIKLRIGRAVKALEPGRRIAVLDDGTELPYDLYLGVPRHTVPQPVVDAGMSEGGWIPIHPRTLETRFPGVYAIGDGAATGTPKAGGFAESAARAVSASIIARQQGSSEQHLYAAVGSCYVETGGGRIGRVDLDFYSGPKLKGVYYEPSVAGRAHKEKFGASRRTRWFGL